MKKKKESKTHSSIGTVGSPNPRLEALLSNFSKKRVLVVGDVGIDRYTVGEVERISPEAPVPIVRVTGEMHKLGLASNVADNIQALSSHCHLVGTIGKDRFAGEFKALLSKMKVSTRGLIVDSTRRTIVKERVVSDRQQLLRVDYESPHAVSPKIEKQILARVKSLIRECDIVILQDYAKGMVSRELAQEIFSIARRAKKIIAVDPNQKTPANYYEGASFITPNKSEAEKLSGIEITDNESLEQAGRKLLSLTKGEYVVITRGKDGMAIFRKNGKGMKLIPTFAREVYDVSGAGDTVIAVMAIAMAAGATIEEAAVLGNLGAGVVVGKRGTATVTRDEIRASMKLASLTGLV